MDHPLFRWQYTALDDNVFSDGRTPDAVTLVAQGSPIPEVVTKSARPTAAGPWWLPQDLAHSDDLVTTALHVAKTLGTLPILETRLLAGIDRLDVLATWDLRIPVFTDRKDAVANQRVREVRRLLRRLVAQVDEQSAMEVAEAVTTAIGDLCHGASTLSGRDGRLAILRFRHETPGGDASQWHICPVLLYESAFDSDSRESGAVTSVGSGREPIRLSQPEGIRRLGLLYAARGDMDQAVNFLVQAAERGDAEAMVSLGQVNRRTPDAEHIDAAYDCFRSAANTGDGPGAFCAGLIQAERGIFEGNEGAEAWWELAAERGIREAPTVLGDRQRQRGDETGADRWWRRGAELGDPNAAMKLGLMRSERSEDWFQDDGQDSAEYWWQRALTLGSQHAPRYLAQRRMLSGPQEGPDGVETWLLRGVEAGDAEAMYAIGLVRQMHGSLDGEDGAWAWVLRAAECGSARAQDAVLNPKLALRRDDGTTIG